MYHILPWVWVCLLHRRGGGEEGVRRLYDKQMKRTDVTATDTQQLQQTAAILRAT